MKNKYYALFGVLFLLLSLGGAYYLTTQNADNRNKATKGQKSAYDIRQEKLIITKLEKKAEEAQQVVDDKNKEGGSQAANDKLAAAKKVLDDAKKAAGSDLGLTYAQCTQDVGFWCGTCGGFCMSGESSCDQAGIDKCNEYPKRGSTVVGVNSTCLSASTGGTRCTCGDASGNANYVCFNNTGTCGTSDDANGLCAVWKQAGYPSSLTGGAQKATTYYCKDKFIGQAGASENCLDKPGANFNINCYCGTIQVDTPGQGFKSESMKCGCDTKTTTNETPSSTPTPPKSTNTPTPILIISLTPTPIIPTNTPVPPTPTTPPGQPTNTPVPPTNTPIPTATPVPPTPGVYACGYTPCDNGGRQCSSGLTCVTANNSAQYCSLPQYVDTCKTNPGYTGCCTAPNIAQGPSPTRIILPVSGVEFPAQALTIVGGIATLLGFLILL